MTTKNDKVPIRGNGASSSNPDKVSCLIVVFLVLAALTPRRPSSVYLNSTDAALDGEWCSSFYFYIMFLHLLQ